MQHFRHYLVFHHVAKAGGVKPALKTIPWRMSKASVLELLEELEQVRGAPLYREDPFALEPAGEQLAAQLAGMLDALGQGLLGFAQAKEDERAAAGLPPIEPDPAAPKIKIIFPEEDLAVPAKCARHNFPFYFAIATAAEAQALILAVSAHTRYLTVMDFPRNMPEVRRQYELECNKWEQEFLKRRAAVRASPTYARLTAKDRDRLETEGFFIPELPAEEE
jgi:hypothetical protein